VGSGQATLQIFNRKERIKLTDHLLADLLAQEGCEGGLLTVLDAEDSLPVQTLPKDTVLALVATGAGHRESWGGGVFWPLCSFSISK
jgi:hypothetical protein